MDCPGDTPSEIPQEAVPADAEDPLPAPLAPPEGFGRVPIQALSERHRARMLAHLLALEAPDRYLRFGYAAGDEQIRRYVEHIDFARDEISGVFDGRRELIALAHLAHDPSVDTGPQRPSTAEFGVSVAVYARGNGLGARLFDHAVLRARSRGVVTIVIHALSENEAMLKIARHAGATLEHTGVDAEACLRLPPG